MHKMNDCNCGFPELHNTYRCPQAPPVNLDGEAFSQLTMFPVVSGSIWITLAHNTGFYATTELPDGWTVQRWGATSDEAISNLKTYVHSGEFDADRN